MAYFIAELLVEIWKEIRIMIIGHPFLTAMANVCIPNVSLELYLIKINNKNIFANLGLICDMKSTFVRGGESNIIQINFSALI